MPSARFCLAALILASITPVHADDEQNRQRIVCLGDSITDGHTYPLLVQQALAASGEPVSIFLNAGIGGDTAEGMLPRLQADVIARKPDIVFVSVGINDFGRGVKLDEFLARVSKIVDELTARNIKVTILTTTSLRDPPSQQRLDEWNAALRQLAKDKNVQLADVAAAFAPRVAAGEDLWEPDGCHLNFAGYRTMVRGVLDGMGHSDVPVPDTQEISQMPGVIKLWRMRVAPDDKPLDETTVVSLKLDDSWKDYTLPDTEKHESWWWDQERQRGFAVYLKKRVADAGRFQGIASINSPEHRTVYFRPGASLRTVWLNGRKIYQPPALSGWHIREGVEATLEAGPNTVVIETGPQFFLSISGNRE